MTDVLNAHTVSRLIKREWRDHNRIPAVAVRGDTIVVSDGFAGFEIDRSSVIMQRLPCDLLTAILNQPEGQYRFTRNETDGEITITNGNFLSTWDAMINNLSAELTRTNALADLSDRWFKAPECARYYSPGLWICEKYDGCINHYTIGEKTYHRSSQSDALVVCDSVRPLMAVMPMVGMHKHINQLITDYAEAEAVR